MSVIWKNIEIHNAAELVEFEDGSVSWKRVPSNVLNEMEGKRADRIVRDATGVELRFVIRGASAVIRMCAHPENFNYVNTFHVFRGGIQGGWEDHEVHCHVSSEVQDFVIKRSANMEKLKEMTAQCGYGWDPEVVRIVFDRGSYKLCDVIGDVVPPTPEQCPKKTLMAYGSSITHGSNSIDASHTWVSILAHNLNMDVRNLGMAGHCMLEPAVAEYVAAEGERGKWDVATLELGINVLSWSEEKINERVENMIRQVAGRNPEKPVFVISPFYHCGEFFNENDNTKAWRRIIPQVACRLGYENVTYISGLGILDNMSYISADQVHPNIYGVQRIADVMTEILRSHGNL